MSENSYLYIDISNNCYIPNGYGGFQISKATLLQMFEDAES